MVPRLEQQKMIFVGKLGAAGCVSRQDPFQVAGASSATITCSHGRLKDCMLAEGGKRQR